MPTIWPILILGFVAFVTSFGAHVVAVNLPIYAAQVGVGVAMIGLLIAAYDAAEVVAKPIFGALADKRGMKQTMLAGILVFVLASLAYLWVPPTLLLLIRFLQGVGAAALSAVSLALVGAYAAERRGRAYGIYNGIKGAGYVVSPIVGGAIVLKSGFSMIFVAAAAIGAAAFLFSLALPKPKVDIASNLDDDDDGIGLGALRAVFKQSSLWPWYVVTVVNMFFVGILFGFLPVRVYALGYGPLVNGLILTAVSASYLLIQPVAGALADRVSPAKTIRVGLLLAGLCVVLTPFVSGWMLAAIAILAGIGVGTVWTNTDALVSQLARGGQLGATMGVAGTFKEIGDMLGPLLIGIVSQAFGLTVGFVASGALGLLALALISRRTPAMAKRTG
ncbi:MAG TPA: MFS transporter [Anaerolineales bacterium]